MWRRAGWGLWRSQIHTRSALCGWAELAISVAERDHYCPESCCATLEIQTEPGMSLARELISTRPCVVVAESREHAPAL
jgi:hypothetical protein